MEQIAVFNSKNVTKIPDIKPGDTVKVYTRIKEGNKERIQIFEGVVIKTQNGKGINGSFTVRKLSYGIGVERTFLLHSPLLQQIKIIKRAKVRRANLGYLRNLKGKAVKLREKQFDILAVNVSEEDLAPLDKETEKLDQELTEISEDVMSEADVESLTEETKKEEKEATIVDDDESASDEQKLPEEEVTEGLEQAERDLEKGKSKEGERQEKAPEDIGK